MPSNIMFLLLLLISTMIVVSSPSWFSIWMGLEMNMMMFIPLLYMTKNKLSSESSLKYFLTQSMASMILLLTVLIMMNKEIYILQTYLMNSMISLSMAIKAGAAPFHMWYPSVVEGLKWMQNLILMTWQKIAPLYTMSLTNSTFMLIMLTMTSSMMGSILALNQTSLRKIMAYSSISHLSWMIAAMSISSNSWMIYMLIYFVTTSIIIIPLMMNNLYHSLQISKMCNNPSMALMLFINLLSLGGFPPLLGFIGKWITLNELINFNMSFIILLLILSSWINLYIYIRILHPTMHIKLNHPKNIHTKKSTQKHLPISTLITIVTIPFIIM